MENKLQTLTISQIFENGEFGKIRTFSIKGEPWFVGKDVAIALGYKDTKNALKAHVDTEDKMGWHITTPSRGKQNVNIINESGLYSLILSSKLSTAKKFKRWVTSEVLPAIRKNRTYSMLPDFTNPIVAAKAWADEVEHKQCLIIENKKLEDQLKEESEFRRRVFESRDCVTYTTAARIIRSTIPGFTRAGMLKYLRSIDAIDARNIPYARHIDLGRLKVKQYEDKCSRIRRQGMVTQKGVEWLLKKYPYNVC